MVRRSRKDTVERLRLDAIEDALHGPEPRRAGHRLGRFEQLIELVVSPPHEARGEEQLVPGAPRELAPADDAVAKRLQTRAVEADEHVAMVDAAQEARERADVGEHAPTILDVARRSLLQPLDEPPLEREEALLVVQAEAAELGLPPHDLDLRGDPPQRRDELALLRALEVHPHLPAEHGVEPPHE